MKKTSILLTLFLVALISGCSSDSSSSSTGNTITLTMNGENITATLISATLVKSAASNEKLLEIYAENDQYRFQVNFFSTYTADDAIPTGTYVYDDSNGTVEGYAYVSYKVNGNTFGMHSPSIGSLNIASINGSSKKASGTFSQTLTGGGELNGETLPSELIITNGVFTNIPYTVVNL